MVHIYQAPLRTPTGHDPDRYQLSLCGPALIELTRQPHLEGFRTKRLKGLEPSTFCMAIGMTSEGIWLIYLQIRWFCGLITRSEWLRIRGDWAQSVRVSGTNPERSDRAMWGPVASACRGQGRATRLGELVR
jgi:hypothetical protein